MKHRDLNIPVLVISGILVYQLIVIGIFVIPKNHPTYPHLQERIGNTLWKPQEIPSRSLQSYCYYPKSGAAVRGELIVQKADSYKDCHEWYGIVEIPIKTPVSVLTDTP